MNIHESQCKPVKLWLLIILICSRAYIEFTSGSWSPLPTAHNYFEFEFQCNCAFKAFGAFSRWIPRIYPTISAAFYYMNPTRKPRTNRIMKRTICACVNSLETWKPNDWLVVKSSGNNADIKRTQNIFPLYLNFVG